MNSIGCIAVPILLKKLGVALVEQVHADPHGRFERVAEPLNEHLGALSKLVADHHLDLGIALDPDVDRLALVANGGQPIGEESSLVLTSEYVLAQNPGPLVANMSSTMVLKEVATKYGVPYSESAVGEVNVVEMMKLKKAVIGGEGNGGIIYPELHYGRDALVGIALILSHLATSDKSLSDLASALPATVMIKDKIELNENVDIEGIFSRLKKAYNDMEINELDGLKITFEQGWAHLRKSNTEPIIRLYIEHKTSAGAKNIKAEILEKVLS